MSNLILPMPGILDASSPPGIKFELNRLKVLFDASAAETMFWVFRMPDDYAGSPVLKLQCAMASATSGKVEFEASIMAVSPGASASIDTDSFDTVNVSSDTVPGTAGYLFELTIALTNDDSLSAGDFVCIRLSRDADDATNDTASGDCELLSATLVYS